jgi:hypothetical protein
VPRQLKDRSLSVWCLGIAMTLATAATSAADRYGSKPELTAVRRAEAILASLDLHAENYEDLDLRLSHQSITIVSWAIELRRLTRLWRDPLLATARIRLFVRPIDKDRFSISRSVNGQTTDAGIVVDRRGAHRWVTSFSDVMLFERFQLARHGDHVLTIISATVEGGGADTVVTSRLGRARLTQ